MSIKADKWIRRMAENEGMIEPFEPGQVRDIDGERIICCACRNKIRSR